MRILAVFDKFKDSFSAGKACSIVEQVAEEISHEIEVVSCPLSDGGEGFVDILTAKYQGEALKVKASDSLGREKRVTLGLVSIDHLSNEVKSFLGLPDSGRCRLSHSEYA